MLFLSILLYRKDLIHLKLVGLWLWVWFILFWLHYFLGSINVITKTTYDPQSYNSPNSTILVYFAGLQFRLFLCFSLLTIALSQPLTSFHFLWVLCSYSLWFFCNLVWFFCNLLCLRGFTLWFFCNLLWFYFIFFYHFIICL